MTADELLEYSNEHYQHELVAGMLREMEPPGALHGALAGHVNRLLANHVAERRLGVVFGEAGFVLATDPDTVRAPDVGFVSAERIRREGLPRGYWSGAPDLAIEILSTHDRRTAVAAKIADWLAAGTRAVVLLDPPAATVTIHRPGADAVVLTERDTLDLGEVVPGFAVEVAALWL